MDVRGSGPLLAARPPCGTATARVRRPGDRTVRRTPGLRREEVAELAHMSVDYYTRLEQARGPRPSARILDALAQALRLTRPSAATCSVWRIERVTRPSAVLWCRVHT